MTEKIEVKLTFKDFAEKHKSILELKQSKADNYQKLLTVKAVEDQTKDIGFSDAWKKELSDKANELQPKAEKELKEASKNIDDYLFTLIKAIFEYHRAVMEVVSDATIMKIVKNMRALIAAGGQLEPEYIFNVVKILYINK